MKKTHDVGGGFQMLPAAEGLCPLCAYDHPPSRPHNAQSMFYQMRFRGAHGRWPTWADACAHCSSEIREITRQVIERKGAWIETAEPIAEIGGTEQ